MANRPGCTSTPCAWAHPQEARFHRLAHISPAFGRAMNMDDLTRIASFAKLYPTLRTDLTVHTHARCMLPAVCTVGCQHPQTPPPLGHSLHMTKRPAMSQLADGKPCHAPYIHLWHVPHILKHSSTLCIPHPPHTPSAASIAILNTINITQTSHVYIPSRHTS